MRMLDGQEIHIPINRKKMRMSDDQEIHIPIDLLREILARLPVKTLLRFRCVCKLWCSLIDSKDFRLNTDNRISTDVLVMRSVKNRDEYIFTVRSTDTFKITDDICTIYESYKLLGTCNGLMLMSKKLSDNTVMLRLWNPSIQKSLILPSCPLSSKEDPVNYVLGYPSSGDNNYKVAAIKIDHYCGGDTWDFFIAVYSFQNHSWSSKIKRKNNVPSMAWMPPLFGRLFFRGAWYWIRETHLVSFDFDSEDFSFVKLPDVTTQGNDSVYRFIFILGESLAVFSLSSVRFCIWVMDKDDNEEPLWRPWRSRDSNHKELSELKNWTYCCSRVFYNQDTDIFIIHNCRKLFSYEFSTHQIITLRRLARDHITIDTYEESLVLHKGTEGQTLTSFP